APRATTRVLLDEADALSMVAGLHLQGVGCTGHRRVPGVPAGHPPLFAVITPLLVATTQRLPRRTMDSTRPSPGTIWPGDTPIRPDRQSVVEGTSGDLGTRHGLVKHASVAQREVVSSAASRRSALGTMA